MVAGGEIFLQLGVAGVVTGGDRDLGLGISLTAGGGLPGGAVATTGALSGTRVLGCTRGTSVVAGGDLGLGTSLAAGPTRGLPRHNGGHIKHHCSAWGQRWGQHSAPV